MINSSIKDILFIDIETVSEKEYFAELSTNMQSLWTKKSSSLNFLKLEDSSPERLYEEKAGIYSEFSKIICISIGRFDTQEKDCLFKVKSLYNHDEKVLLKEFLSLINGFEKAFKAIRFCGHNIKEFDLPFICRRLLIQQLEIPKTLNLSLKKPWEIPHLDTLELWKFGDYKNYTSLALLAEILGIPSPKEDMDGSEVGRVYWKKKDLDRIARYCQNDVISSAKVYLRLSGLAPFDYQIVYL